jgi:diguanylate cyclase (GGDEF)-like protein
MLAEINRRWKFQFYGAISFAMLLLFALFGVILFSHDEHASILYCDILTPIVDILVFSALVFTSVRLCKYSRRISLVWSLIALAEFFTLLADLSWSYIEVVQKHDPSGALIESIYLLFYPVIFAAILLMPTKPENRIVKVKRILDWVIILVAAVLGYWNFIVAPLSQITQTSILEQIIVYIFPILDLMLFWILLSVSSRLKARQYEAAFLFLAFSFGITIIADVFYSYQAVTNIYYSGGWVDFGWLISAIMIGVAGLVQSVLVESNSINIYQDRLVETIKSKIYDLLPYAPFLWLLAAYLLLIASYINRMMLSFLSFAIGVGIILVLAVVRQYLTQHENNHLTGQLQGVIEILQNQTEELNETNKALEIEVVERKRAEEQLIHDALHDWLTGLPNRFLFIDRLGQAIEYTIRRPDVPFAVLFLDLDQFKVINDSLGHNMGDELLVHISKRLQECLRSSDTVARLGGDEFVMLLENVQDESMLENVTNRIQETINIPFKLDGHDVYITASIGVIPSVLGYQHAEDVLRDADLAMYQAKSSGKAHAEAFQSGMRIHAISRLDIENDLRQALEHCEFLLYYQPIFDLRQNELVGYEALIRWSHPRRGLLSPIEFIPIAEESGLIIPIGKWVMLEACYQVKKWQKENPDCEDIRINVNISGKQITQPDFLEQVQRVLFLSGLKPSALKLEITESVLMENYAMVNQTFSRLSNMGVQVEIDDFGTGYSSLGYLQNFPVQAIKIDKTFIREIGSGGKSADIVRAMISMANDLRIDTIAEGVETREQLKTLKEMKCPYGQGFLLSRPLDAISAGNFLKSKVFVE